MIGWAVLLAAAGFLLWTAAGFIRALTVIDDAPSFESGFDAHVTEALAVVCEPCRDDLAVRRGR